MVENNINKKGEWKFVPNNKTKLLCRVNIPENVVDCLEELIKLNKLEDLYQLEDLKEDIMIAVKADMEILLKQKEKIINIPYLEWGETLLEYTTNRKNWFSYHVMLFIYNDKIKNMSDIEKAYECISLSAKFMLKKEKKECICNLPSLLDLIYKYSKQQDVENKYIKYNDKDIFGLLKDINDKKDIIFFNIYKEIKGSDDCFLKLNAIENGYVVELNKKGSNYKYFYNYIND